MSASRFRLAARMADIAPFHVMRILARARRMEAEGRAIVHMEVGEPPFPTPAPVIAAAHRALDANQTSYTPALGLPALRAAIADYYRRRFDVHPGAGRVVVTPGSSAGLQLVLAMLCGPEDEILLCDPGYPCNRHFSRLFDARPVSLTVSAGDGYLPTLEQLEAAWTPATRALLLASPANPTGALIPIARLRDYAAFVAARGGVLIVDEIYQGIVHRGASTTALAVGEDLIVVNSFSKYFCMTGWRVGWLVLPEALVEAADRLAQNMYLAAPTMAQHAAITALDSSVRLILEQRRIALGRKLEFVRDALQAIGLKVPLAPGGAFYLYAGLGDLPLSASEFSRRLLDEKGVAVTPGIDFGEFEAERHIRLACVAEDADLRRAVVAIAEFVEGLRG